MIDDDALTQFMSITNVDDLDTARHFLEASNWNVENAVDLYFNNPTTSSTTTQQSSTSSPLQQHDYDSQVRAPMQFQQEATRLYDYQQGGIGGGYQPQQGFNDDIPPHMYEQFMTPPQRREPERPSTFSGTAHLRDMFSAPTEILFHGSFNDAKAAAQDSEKWLLVNLQDDSVFACHELNRDVWRDETVQNLVLCFFTLWQVDRATESGRQFMRLYGIAEYEDFPILAIVDPRTGELVKKLNGKVNKNALIDELQKFPDTHSLRDDYMRISQQPTPSTTTTTATSTPGQFGMAVDDMDDEEQMLQAAIRASIEEAERSNSQSAAPAKSENVQDVDMIDNIQPSTTSSSVTSAEQPTQETEFVLPSVDVDSYLVKEGGTRVQLVNGSKRSVHRLALNTPLAAIYHLFDRELEEKRPFAVTFAGKRIEPALDRTLESENMKNASFNLVFE